MYYTSSTDRVGRIGGLGVKVQTREAADQKIYGTRRRVHAYRPVRGTLIDVKYASTQSTGTHTIDYSSFTFDFDLQR